MIFSDKDQGAGIDIQSLVDQLKQFLGPNENLVIMLTTENDTSTDYDVATTMESDGELQAALSTYADFLDGDDCDESVDELGEGVDDEGAECRLDHILFRGKTLQ